MFDLKKLRKLIEAINTYYAFAVLLYTLVLFIAANTEVFVWIFAIVTPFLAGWGGYLFYDFLAQRNQRHGFRILSDSMSYEINSNHRSVLRYTTKIRADTNHLMVYPVGYQWSGSGEEGIPKVSGKGQQLLALFKNKTSRGSMKPAPYVATTVSTEGDWHYWFIALNPPVHKDEEIEVKYSQEFHDKKGVAKPYLYYFARTKMERLELNVKFPANARPQVVTSSYIKPSEPSRPYTVPGAVYNPERQWATWVIEKPKKGYCYRIHWQ
ncbi:MAG TPA: hypothetical protein VD907_01225 [Verrucomicrobiae bacterium]|nr:hypothetical protein [Verrucomicrobiae bacterium]